MNKNKKYNFKGEKTMEKKITNRQVLEAIAKAVKADEKIVIAEGTVVTGEEVIAYAEKAIAQLDAKAEKAKAKAAEKRAEGDDLRNAIKAVITDEYQGVADILGKVEADYPEITKAKVVARLTQLIKAGDVEKDLAKTEDGKKVTVYRLAGSAEEE